MYNFIFFVLVAVTLGNDEYQFREDKICYIAGSKNETESMMVSEKS